MEIPQGLSEHIKNRLVPINRLSAVKRRQLLENIVIDTHPVGACIFMQGEVDDNVYYLLAGKINMMATDESTFAIESTSEQACYPIGQMQPRQYSAHVIREAMTLKVSKALFDSLLNGDNQGSPMDPEYDEVETEVDWMSQLLESGIFTRIPPQNIQKLFELFEEISIHRGSKIISQGEPGDYFYIIKTGRFEVTRCMAKQNKTFRLATLGVGNSFGEESLLGDVPRNASVTALTDGILMRITKESFISLIRDPAINSIEYDDAERLIKSGGAWLDVRNQDEYNLNGLDNGHNLPLETLRVQLDKLNTEIEYVVYCNDGSRSAIAAYLLVNKGYRINHLRGGLLQNQILVNTRFAKTCDPGNSAWANELDGSIQVHDTPPGKAFNDANANIYNLCLQQDNQDDFSKALKTLMAGLVNQLEQALREKAEAEIARDLAEQKLAALQLRIKHTHRSRQRVLTGAH